MRTSIGKHSEKKRKKGVGKKLLARIEIFANQVAQIIRDVAKFVLV